MKRIGKIGICSSEIDQMITEENLQIIEFNDILREHRRNDQIRITWNKKFNRIRRCCIDTNIRSISIENRQGK